MRADMNKSDGLIQAWSHDHVPVEAEFDRFVTLAFKQGDSILTLFLPAKMAACAAMIAGAFNAHMAAEPGVGVREQVARERVVPGPDVPGNRGGAGGGGIGGNGGTGRSVSNGGGSGNPATTYIRGSGGKSDDEDDRARAELEGTSGVVINFPPYS